MNILAWILAFIAGLLVASYLPSGEEIDYDLIQTIIATFGLAGLWLVYGQLKVSHAQLQQTTKWNKLRSFHDYFSDVPTREHQTHFFELLADFDHNNQTAILEKIKKREALTRKEAEQLRDDADVSSALYAYLDDYEELCGAIRSGIVDEDYAYSMDRTRICRTRTVYKTFIDLLRDSDGGRRISCAYEELYQVADFLDKMSDNELQKIRNNRTVRKSL